MRRLEWERIKISDASFEAVGVFDVNNDGIPDLVSGGFWYEGPDWKQHKLCDVRAEGEYYDDFSTLPLDVNGDGYLDTITGGWWGQTLVWRENPKGRPEEWTTHEIDHCGSIETTRMWDVDGDGELEIVPNTPGNPLVCYKLVRDASGKGTGEFKKYVISEAPSGHGLGFGDLLGDGRGCFITPTGWWEPPEEPLAGEWTFHPEFDLGNASVPIIVADVNGDGLNDLIVGQAHGYGLDWYEQVPQPDSGRKWVKHPIDPWFSQYHELQWVDIDGDGQNELITGNRYRAHCGHEAGENEDAGLFIFKWTGECFAKQVVNFGRAGEASGTGIQFAVADLDGNGRLDIVAAGKEGLFLFRNLGFEHKGGE